MHDFDGPKPLFLPTANCRVWNGRCGKNCGYTLALDRFSTILHHSKSLANWPIIILPQETHAPQLRRLLDAGLQRLPWNQYLRLANDANGSQALRIVRMAVSMSKLNTVHWEYPFLQENRSSPPCPQAWMMPIIKISSDAGMFNRFFFWVMGTCPTGQWIQSEEVLRWNRWNRIVWNLGLCWVQQHDAIPRRNPGCTTRSCWKNEWLNLSEKRLKTAAISYILERTRAKTGRQKGLTAWQADHQSCGCFWQIDDLIKSPLN